MKGTLKETMCRTQKEMKNHDEDVNISSILTEHQSKEKFRDSRKDLKFVKMRNALGRHTYGNQKEIKKKDEDIQRIYTLRKKRKKRERKRFQEGH